MSSPQTINGLMRHLRNDRNIQINGSQEKKQLICYGYYHGYKGYRFVRNSQNQIPYTKFSEVVAVIEYDSNLKAALYSDLMFIETAIKNIVCNESVNGLRLGTFEHVYKERMKDNPTNAKQQTKRLRLRNTIYSRIATRYHDEKDADNQMVRHFYNRGEDAPLWVVFEILYLTDLASFFECLDKSVREKIMVQLDMFDAAIDTDRALLGNILYTLKALRNSVAHNNVIFDTRFKDRKISTVVKKWTEQETGINNITLYSLVDYIIIICCLLKRLGFNSMRAKQLVKVLKEQNQQLSTSVAPNIYAQIVPQNFPQKLAALELYLNT